MHYTDTVVNARKTARLLKESDKDDELAQKIHAACMGLFAQDIITINLDFADYDKLVELEIL